MHAIFWDYIYIYVQVDNRNLHGLHSLIYDFENNTFYFCFLVEMICGISYCWQLMHVLYTNTNNYKKYY